MAAILGRKSSHKSTCLLRSSSAQVTRREAAGVLTGLSSVRLSAQEIVNLRLVDIVVGEYSTSMRLPENFAFSAGMPVFISFRVVGAHMEPELNLISLDYALEALDAAGNLLDRPITGRYARRVPSVDETPMLPLVRGKIVLPEFVHPGEGKFRIRLTDRLTKQTATGETTFPVHSNFPKPSGTFEILDLKLYRGESDESALEDPVFQPGEQVWARFLLASFLWKEREYDLRYGVTVAGRDGRVVLSVPDAVAERNRNEYLKAYVPAVTSVRLERNLKPGPYTLTVAATDGVAQTQAKGSAAFRVASSPAPSKSK